MNQKILLVFALLLSLSVCLFAQSSGKVVGVVKDKESGEPLPGVNVSLEGTTYGAATDVDGYYVILQVPVGIYDVKASFIGYKEVTQTGARVSASITTEANFSMEEAVVEGEGVIITAEKPLVEKNVTQSVSLVTSEQLENVPVRGFNNVMATQKSVVVQDNIVYIRGGRNDEVGYYVDGAASTNPLTNTQSIHIIQEAVEEFQVLAGGYTAEFGGANAGIIRTELKTGGNDIKASVDFQTDKFASEGEKFLGTYSYRHHTAVGTISGPLFSNKVRFFAALENQYQGDRAVRFGEPFTFTDVVDANVQNNPKYSGANAVDPDVVPELSYLGGFTPDREEDQWAIQSTLSLDLSPVTFRLSASWNDRTRQNTTGIADDTPVLDVLNDRYWDDTFTNTLISGKMTYVVSPTTLLDANISFFNSKREFEDSYFGNDWRKWYDSTAVANHTGGDVTYEGRWRPETRYLFNGIPFARNGDPRNGYLSQDQQYLGGALNFVSQINRHHELKVGGDLRRYTLRRFFIETAAMSQLTDKFATPEDLVAANGAKSWISAANPNNYGYDIFGNTADSDVFDDAGIQTAQAPNNPIFASFYVQDKIEYNDLIINAGLRMDYFDTKDRELIDPENPARDQAQLILDEANAWRDKDAFTQISPRLGFSFPVSEKTVFYTNYGKFVQMPELETIYNGVHAYNREYLQSGLSFQNPSGFGLDPIKTTSYEIGFRQQLGSVAAFDIGGFYRNVRGQVQVDRIFPDGFNPFNVLVNGDFATTKGLELSLNLRRINRLQGALNYTLTTAEGTNSTRTSDVAVLENNSTNRPSVVNPLDFNQRHRGSVIFDYRWGQNDGGPVLSNLGLNSLVTFNSGHPFTLTRSQVGQAGPYDAGTDYMNDTRSRRALEEIGASTTPFNWQMDLRLDKSFNIIETVRATVYARINNVFNVQNVVNVFNSTGSAEDDGFINNRAISQPFIDGNGGEDYVNLYKAVNIDNGQAYWDQLGLQLYGQPRQIFFGIKLSY